MKVLDYKNERMQTENEAHLRQLEIEDDPQLKLEEKKCQGSPCLREETKQKQLETREKEMALEERRWQLEQAQMREYFAVAMEMLERFKPRYKP